jgi:hypothetical protein
MSGKKNKGLTQRSQRTLRMNVEGWKQSGTELPRRDPAAAKAMAGKAETRSMEVGAVFAS